jgi:MSHA biogenesis protein MshI
MTQPEISTLLETGSFNFALTSVVLQSYVHQQQLRGQECSFILPASDYRLMLLDAPKVPDEELNLALPWLVKDLIDQPIEELALDAFKLPMGGDQVEKIYVVIAEKDRLRKSKQFINEAKLRLAKIDILELALLPIAKQLSASEKGCGLIYQNGQDVNFLLTKNGQLHFTRKLGTMVNLETGAENQPLILELQRSIDFCQIQLRQTAPETIHLMPGLEALTQETNEVTLPLQNVSAELFIEDPKKSLCLATLGEALSYEATD